MKTKLTIKELRVKSFITSITDDKGGKVKGGTACWWFPTDSAHGPASSKHDEP